MKYNPARGSISTSGRPTKLLREQYLVRCRGRLQGQPMGQPHGLPLHSPSVEADGLGFGAVALAREFLLFGRLTGFARFRLARDGFALRAHLLIPAACHLTREIAIP